MRQKFADQGWLAFYYTLAFTSGLLILMEQDWGFSVDGLWQGYPHRELSLVFKTYYLLQLAYCIHQLFVQYIEVWRGDVLVYFAHHFITIGLIVASYRTYWTHFGISILVEQDCADIVLPIAKMFKYIGESSVKSFAGACNTLADVFFALFSVVWIPTRHVVLPIIIYSIWTYDLPYSVCDGIDDCYWSKTVRYSFFGTLFVFHGLLLIWLRDLLLGIYAALFAGTTNDHRSDSDSEDGSEGKKKKKAKKKD